MPGPMNRNARTALIIREEACFALRSGALRVEVVKLPVILLNTWSIARVHIKIPGRTRTFREYYQHTLARHYSLHNSANSVIDDQKNDCANHCYEQAPEVEASDARRSKNPE